MGLRINFYIKKNVRGGAFFEKFSGIEDCINEEVRTTPQNHFEKRIRDIERSLSYNGIDLY